MGFHSWIHPLPPKQHGFLVLNFINLAILVGEKNGKNSVNSRENGNKKKSCQKLEIKNLKKNILMNKFLKIIIIIPTLNT
jgi:hypothetical protein